MTYKVIEKRFLWYRAGDLLSDEDELKYTNNLEKWVNAGYIEEVKGSKKKSDVDLDLNDDGKVDEKDAGIASKVMNVIKKKKKKSKKKKK